MEQTGEYRLPADRDTVWAALNDPEVLARCIDGCQSMEKVSDERYDAVVKSRIGPVRANFDVVLELQDIVPPEHYTISGNVKGGPAGFARGTATVHLSEEGDTTVLRYSVNANVGGRLAQLGSRLIDSSARKLADDFFSAFEREFAAPADQRPETGAEAERQAPADAPAREYETAGGWKIWVAAFVALLLALLFAF